MQATRKLVSFGIGFKRRYRILSAPSNLDSRINCQDPKVLRANARDLKQRFQIHQWGHVLFQ